MEYEVNKNLSVVVPKGTVFDIRLGYKKQEVELSRFEVKVLQAALGEAWLAADRQEAGGRDGS